ncbi:MAG: cytochrome c [Betaproteobacteria bacterium]|nr:cytochrome c [Betaproteobacteria bacterium]MDH5219740.1 cytochrome c [Betaproteobacteria bacterium]MDH5350487.1 cytochrome c [Betaproteobacteria bacterium]
MSATRSLATALAAAALLAGAITARAADVARGAQTYQRHCANCHGPTGVSTWPGAPSFARREGLMRPDALLLDMLRTGRGVQPGFRGLLTDTEILDAIAYSRTLAR